MSENYRCPCCGKTVMECRCQVRLVPTPTPKEDRSSEWCEIARSLLSGVRFLWFNKDIALNTKAAAEHLNAIRLFLGEPHEVARQAAIAEAREAFIRACLETTTYGNLTICDRTIETFNKLKELEDTPA